MHSLLGHLRTIKLRKRSEKPVEIDLAEGFKLNVAGSGRAFLEKELEPAARASRRSGAANSATVSAPGDRKLHRSGSTGSPLILDAGGAALAFRSNETRPTLFFKRTREADLDHADRGAGPAKQQTRIIQLVGEIERGVKPTPCASSKFRKRCARRRSPTCAARHSTAKQYSARVLRRISVALGQDPGPVNRDFGHHRAYSAARLRAEKRMATEFPEQEGGSGPLPQARQSDVPDGCRESEQPTRSTGATSVRSTRARSSCWQTASAPRPTGRRNSITSRTEDMIRILFEAWDDGLKPRAWRGQTCTYQAAVTSSPERALSMSARVSGTP